MNYQSQQWLWDAYVEGYDSTSGTKSATLFGQGSLRYQVDSQLSVGASASVRQYDGTGMVAQAFVERSWKYGTSRVQLMAAPQDSENRAAQVLVDHSWALQVNNRLTTGISVSQETIAGRSYNTVGLLAYGGGNLVDNLTLDGNVRLNYTRNNGSGLGAFVNLSLNWMIDTHWTVIATAYDNRDDTAKLYVIDPPSQGLPELPVQHSRAFFLTLRYEDRAGTARLPLGGSPGSGAAPSSGTCSSTRTTTAAATGTRSAPRMSPCCSMAALPRARIRRAASSSRWCRPVCTRWS